MTLEVRPRTLDFATLTILANCCRRIREDDQWLSSHADVVARARTNGQSSLTADELAEAANCYAAASALRQAQIGFGVAAPQPEVQELTSAVRGAAERIPHVLPATDARVTESMAIVDRYWPGGFVPPQPVA